MVVGGRAENGDAVNTRWNFEYAANAGYRLKDFTIEQPQFNSLTGISIIQYADHLMMFGGIDNDLTWRSDMLLSDDEGMHWYKADTAHNQLPETYQSRQKQSVVVDEQNNIYIIGGQSSTETFSDVYRGYLNSINW
jgi:dihydrofolate reductase